MRFGWLVWAGLSVAACDGGGSDDGAGMDGDADTDALQAQIVALQRHICTRMHARVWLCACLQKAVKRRLHGVGDRA
jgi:hypothetical protein